MNQEWKEENDITETFNPNLGKKVQFKGIKLAKEPLCWPYIEIQIDDMNREGGFISMNGGCENCFTTLSLIDYASHLVDKHQDIMYARE